MTAAEIPASVRRQAAEWLVELQSDAPSDDIHRRWQQWRDADPTHERAWRRVEAFRQRLQHLPAPLARAALAPAGSARRRQVVAALAVALFTTGGFWALRGTGTGARWAADHRTGTGEQRTIALPDGTQLQLNSDTALDTRYDAQTRTVALLHGEILVTTAHDPLRSPTSARPFMVQTRQGRLRALGTRFTVRDLGPPDDGQVRVAVFEGAVEVRPAAAPLNAPGHAPVLAAGEQARFTRDAVGAISPADENSLAWTEGLIVAQDMRLGSFLAELARYRSGRLTCDPAVADLKVSGVYPLADTDRVLAVLSSSLPVRVSYLTRYWVRVQAQGR